MKELKEKEPLHRVGVGLVLAAAVAVLLGIAAIGLPREGAPLPDIARQALALALPQWRTTEPVNEVVYGTRAFDTFGETFLLLAAVVSVLLLTRHREPRRGYFGEEDEARRESGSETHEPPGPEQQSARAALEREEIGPSPGLATPDEEPVGTPAPETAEGMTVIVRVAMRLVLPLLAVAGLYLFLLGYAPGGGFPAGVVLLGVVLLVYASVGYRRIAPVIRPGVLEVLELIGAVAVIVVLGLGLPLKGSFGANWLPLAPERTIRSGGILQAFSTAEVIEVATGLIIVVFAIMAMLHDWIPGDDDSDQKEREK